MPLSRFSKPTSQNIVYTGSNEELAPNEIATLANQNKYLKNANGTLQWVALPLPDVANIPQSQDTYAVTFDFATQSFLLRYIKIPYNAIGDTAIKMLFLPNMSNTTFVSSTLTHISNLATTGRTYDISSIDQGQNAQLGLGGQGINTSFNRGYVGLNIDGFPTSNNWSMTMCFKLDTTTFSSQRSYFLFRSQLANYSSVIDGSLIVLNLLSASTGNLTLNAANHGNLNVQSNTLTMNNNENIIVSTLCYNGVCTIYFNGLLVGSVTGQAFVATNNEAIRFLTGETGQNASIFGQQQMFVGTMYGWNVTENATLAQMQRIEAWYKYASPISNLAFTLDPSHPYANGAPNIN